MSETIKLSEHDRQAFADLLAAREESEVRIPVYAVKLTVLIEAESETDAYDAVHTSSEGLFDVWGVRSIYYADVIHKIEVDENGDILADSVPDGFTFG